MKLRKHAKDYNTGLAYQQDCFSPEQSGCFIRCGDKLESYS